jgi:hypothetical protein
MALEGIPVVTGTTAFPNANRDTAAPNPAVPEMIEGTTALVKDIFEHNLDAADALTAGALATIAALANAKLPPALPDPPAPPSIVTTVDGAIDFSVPSATSLGSVTTDALAAFVPEDVVIPDITPPADYVPVVEAIANIEPPALNLPNITAPPGLNLQIDTPTAPVDTIGPEPILLELEIPVLNMPALPLFNDTAPTFGVAPPSPFINWTEPTYTSTVSDAVKAVLLAMLVGGTGLTATVENAIWERERAREEVTTARAINEMVETWSARNFSLPQGPLEGARLALIDDRDLKVNGVSRDIAVKQADLEQKNREFAVEKGIAYEQLFTTLYMSIVDRNFQIAKFGVETAIQIYNAQVTAFGVEQAIFTQKIALYTAQLQGVFAYLKAFEALVSVEKAKADMNVAKVQAYGEKVKVYNSRVEAFKALIQAQQAKADLQKAVMDGYRAEIEGKVALVNGERAKMDAYVARMQGETARAGLEESHSRAYVAQVSGFAAKNDVLFKRVDAQISKNRNLVDYAVANVQRLNGIHSTELGLIQANLAAFQGSVSAALASSQVQRERLSFNRESQTQIANLLIERYRVATSQWTTRAQEIIQMATINAESLRAAGQIGSNLAAGMMAGIHAAVGLTAGASSSDSNQTSSSNQTSQSKIDSTSNSYQVLHQFSHRV